MSSIGELTFFLGLQVQQKRKGIFISQDKYVHEILRKFNYSDVKSASTPTDLEKPLVQDGDAADVSPKTSHLLAVKRIFRYLKGKPSLGLWYSKDSSLELVAYTDSDYAGATLDRKSTTRVATSTTEAEYVTAASCCGQVLWIQNQLLDYGYNFMDNVIYIDNTITICIIENHVQHSKTKHIEIRHHFIRDCNAKKLIQMAKIDNPRSYPTRLLTVLFMANLEFCDKHNMVAFLEKSTGSAGFHQIIDFLNQSHICYALTKKPEVCVSFIKQFWRSAEVTTAENGEVKITATIDGHLMTITEGSLRRHLKLDDQDGISSIPNSEIFEQLALMGYHTDSDKLTFQKGAFSPQWRFLIHSILHCLSPKKTAWEQFSSNIATAVICLATNRKYNFSRMIFEHMVSNISSPHKFLMYPRFIQICLDMQRNQLQQHSRTYPVPSLSNKVFNNMKRPTKGFSGQEVALFPTMLDVTEPSTSPSRITSSPSHSPEHSPSPTHSPSPAPSPTPEHITAAPTQPSPTQPSPLKTEREIV
ncbi:hypothetical protein Tco_1198960 [Tanacetum coccineum]